jgi:hypothetical protein
MKRVEIAYTPQMFEEIVNRSDINILQIDVKGMEPNALFQQGFIGIIYYEEIGNNADISKEMIKAFQDIYEGAYPSSVDEAFIFVDIAKKIAKDILDKVNK